MRFKFPIFCLIFVIALLPLLAHPGAAETAEPAVEGERYVFQAEVSRLLNLIINSLYTKKEIFLRELISNASDALDKFRYLALTNPDFPKTTDLHIAITVDKENRKLTVQDNGIGMTHSDLIDSLGTIASSGTKKFIDALSAREDGGAQPDMNLIGQFGVGFYSVYLVAENVEVVSKHPQDATYEWSSTAQNEYVIRKLQDEEDFPHGTRIVLTLQGDATEYLEDYKLKELVKRYSEFINYPIKLNGEVINDVNPIWTRAPKDISDEEYQAFYKAITKEFDNSTSWTHFKAEGDIGFRSILYVPGHAPSDVGSELNRARNAVKLFVRRVFISDEIDDILPRYLAFLRGIVDSEDLPLNVSREFLQQSRLIKLIRKKLVRKALEMLADLAESSKEKYEKFYRDFSVFLKIGVIEDSANRGRLAKLLRYESLLGGADLQSLDEYVAKRSGVSASEESVEPEVDGEDGEEPKKSKSTDTKPIYYIAGTNKEELLRSPLLEPFRSAKVDVLLFTDPVDEYMLQSYTEFEGHKLQDISKEDLDLSEVIDAAKDESKTLQPALEEQYKPLTEYLKKTLGDKVSRVQLSSRLVDTPCVLTSGAYGVTANMERILRAQALNDASSRLQRARRIMEINPYHRVVRALLQKIKNGEDVNDLAVLLYESAALQSGFDVADPMTFADRVQRVIGLGLRVADVSAEDDASEVKALKEKLAQRAVELQAEEERKRAEAEEARQAAEESAKAEDVDVDASDEFKEDL